jgi:beta-barrel assembly-enhancing protease
MTMAETFKTAAPLIQNKHWFQRPQKFSRRYLAWLPFMLLAACAGQPLTSQPPQTPQPVIESSIPGTAAPDTASSLPAPAAEVPAAPPQGAADPAISQKITTLRAWADQENRLYTLAAPLLTSNVALCKQSAHYLLGFTAKTKYSYSNAYIGAAQAGLGLGEQLRVMNVLPGSGAALSGIQQGDILLAVEDKPLSPGPDAEKKAGLLISDAIRQQSSLKLMVLRNGSRLELQVPLTNACAIGVELGDTDDVNSYADGRRVMITRGMLNFTRSDEELAYALAKEIAHAILNRSGRPRMKATIDRLRLPAEYRISPAATTTAPPLPPYTPVLDATADKLALYLLARAGYGIDNTLSFWTRLAAQYPASVQNGHTALHPSTPYRVSVMTQVVRAIRMKQKNGLPLMP